MSRPSKTPAKLDLEIVIDCEDWRASIDDVESLARRIGATAASFEPKLTGSVALLLTDDDAVRDLNARFRGKNKPTNVLSFPSGGAKPELIGDIALAFETCAREADEQRKTLADHAAHLIAHGLLHLVGYDHQTGAEALVMEGKEVEILASLGIANPYSEKA